MTTRLEIVNQALMFLGNEPVNSLNTSNTIVSALASIYDTLKLEILATHPWHFALRWEILIRDPSTPLDPRWQYSYQLPPDYIQAWETFPWGNYTIVHERLIWTNINPPWKWGYISNVSEGYFPSYFEKLMSLSLAADSAMLVTENPQIANYWEGKASKQRVIAQNRDFTAQPNPSVRDNRLWAAHNMA